LGLTQDDAAAFLKKMADESHSLGMGIGLKNAQEILPAVSSEIEFAVNEECTKTNNCELYLDLLGAGKPVFHIEYGDRSNMTSFCLQSMQKGAEFDTVIKHLALDGWVLYCDGSEFSGS
jgi:hypothetical protein